MRIVQQPSRFQRTEFEFGDKELKYVFDGEFQKTEFTVPYTAVGTSKSTRSFRSPLMRLFGLALGLPSAIAIIVANILGNSLHKGVNFSGMADSPLLLIPAFGCCVMWAWSEKHAKQDMFVIPAGIAGANIFIFHDDQHQAIINEIKKRKTSELRRIYGKVDILNHPEIELKRFLWLKEQSVISNEEFSEARLKISEAARTPHMSL